MALLPATCCVCHADGPQALQLLTGPEGGLPSRSGKDHVSYPQFLSTFPDQGNTSSVFALPFVSKYVMDFLIFAPYLEVMRKCPRAQINLPHRTVTPMVQEIIA